MNKQGRQPRRLPQWYREAVDMVAEVFANAPETADKSTPYVNDSGYGRGVQSYRRGFMASNQPRLGTSDTQPDPANPTEVDDAR